MNTLSLEMSFYNSESSAYIGFTMPEDCDDPNNESYIEFGFNMEYMLEMGLGQIIYQNDLQQKGSFRNFLKNFITNPVLVKKLLTSKTKNNYRSQMLNIMKNPTKYFGESLTEMPNDVILILEEKFWICINYYL